tara:strand:- start:2114 stop:2449 length:336 start_codon:yes stop_codon:yes gene_type:complete
MESIVYKIGLLFSLPIILACAPLTGGVPPVLEFVPQPFYSGESVNITVKTLLSINEKGRVTEVEITEIIPAKTPQDKVLKAIRKARFVPYKRSQQTIRIRDFEHVFEFSAN